MPLQPGTKLGPYEILAHVGAGGMGEVYRGRDTRLDRTVAIKVLPAHLAGHPELRQRFEREARAVSSLNHAHICALYDVGEQDGIHFLVMEYVDGETLAVRISRGPLPLDEAFRYAVEIADALDNAHRHNIVHRDLKPGNIMVTKSGTKLLDFGLARLKQPSPPATFSSVSASALPTDAGALTAGGEILGTLQYMAPEQLEAKEADARADIWAFGCLLYEMLTGRRAFDGSSQASLISSIMSGQPEAITTVQPMTPPALDRLLRVCLNKDRDARWQSAGDLLHELEWIRQAQDEPAVLPTPTRRSVPLIIASALLTLLVIASLPLAIRHLAESPPESESLRFTVTPTGPTVFSAAVNGIHISPDGRQIAFVGETASTEALWLRPLDGVEAKLLPGTEGASQPFWSPDSRSIGFFASAKLKIVDLGSGAIKALADARDPCGGNWGRDGTILFTPACRTIFRISSSGGAAAEVLALDTARKESSQRWPVLMPDGRHFLYVSVISTGGRENAVHLALLDSQDRTRLFDVDSRIVFSPAGLLLFQRQGALMAQRIDVERLSLAGEPAQIAPSVDWDRVFRGITASASDTGVLVYRAGIPGQKHLLWMDRGGRRLGLVGEPDNYYHPALSRDETRLALGRTDGTGKDDVWVIDLQRGTRSRITRNPGGGAFPLWSPDGRHLLFTANPAGPENVYRKLASGAGDEELFFASELSHKHPQQWTSDGRFIVFDSINDVWALPLTGERKPILILGSDANEGQPRVSPDGRWIAYASDETGRPEVYVQPFPPSGDKWQISTTGGGQPRWRGDGKELFYIAADRRLMAVSVKTEASFQAGLPQALFETPVTFVRSGIDLAFPDGLFIPSADGQRFLFLAPVETTRAVPATVITNWTRLVRPNS